jgi:fructose-1-phosphate kinase PfkB-like protein
VFLLKASLEELARDGLLGADATAAVVLDRASQWLTAGVSNVCVSLGSAGLVWMSADGIALLAAEPVTPFNTIGCGDALVGAVAAALDSGRSVGDALVTGVAAATANLAYDAPGHCTMDDVSRLSPSVRCDVGDEAAVVRAIAESRPK